MGKFFRFILSLFKSKPTPPRIGDIIPIDDRLKPPPSYNTQFDAYINFYSIAARELGTKEAVIGSNPRIIEYHNATTLSANNDDVPWCASFINWALVKFFLTFFPVSFLIYVKRKIVPSNVVKAFGLENGVLNTEESSQLGTLEPDPHWLPTFSAGAYSFLTWGYPIKNPIRGCIVVMKRFPNPDIDRHVGIFDHISGDMIYLLGGNQGNAVTVRAHKLSWVLDYRGFYPEEN